MAFLDTSKKPFINDRNENVFLGIDFPFRRSLGTEGWFASTTTTIDTVKEDIRMLLMTEKGERILQPNLGIGIRKYLFLPFEEETEIQIHNEIASTLSNWLPHVEIKRLDIQTGEPDYLGRNSLKIFISFNIIKDPNTLESVGVEIGI